MNHELYYRWTNGLLVDQKLLVREGRLCWYDGVMTRGSDWGEAGYIRLRRGEGMCGIGQQYAVPVCRKEEGTTSAPVTVTTSTPCQDKYTNCHHLAETNCREHGEHCPQVS